MRRILVSIYMFVFTISLFAVEVASIPVEFTAGRTHNIGFSESMLSSTIAPESSLESVSFSVDSDFLYYSTGPFYMYLQLFTPYRVRVYIEATALTGDNVSSLGYENIGNTSLNFGTVDASDGFKKSVLYEEQPSEQGEEKQPRTHNFEFSLRLPISEIKIDAEYRAKMTIYLESIQ